MKKGHWFIDLISLNPLHRYLTEIPCYFDIMPIIVIKFSIDRLHQGFKGPGSQINDQRNSAVFQRQVDVVGRFARVQHQSVPLQGFKRERDLIAAALYRVLRQVVAEVLGTFEGRYVFFFPCKGEEKKEKERAVLTSSVRQVRPQNQT